jgi:1-pyrroline-5-carboxylate dehydrogenase
MWNQLEYRAARGLRLRDHAVQLHGDRRQPAHRAGADGQHVVWKPASSAMLSGYYTMRLLEEAGLPPGVINFVPATPVDDHRTLLLDAPRPRRHPLHRQHRVFNIDVEDGRRNIGRYRSYPRLVGETGGKDFIVAHPSADPQAVAVAIVRGGFEYQGQKCSAASRVYVPQSIWNEVRDRTVAMMKDIKGGRRPRLPQLHGRGDRQEGVRPHQRVPRRREAEREDPPGRRREGREGYFIEPTLVETDDPGYRLMCEEIFGPVVTAYVYPDAKWEETLRSSTDVALRADRRDLRARPARRAAGDERAAQRGRQLLHQRQADRRRRRAAAVRRRAGVGHERQGRLEAEPGPLGQARAR